MVLARKESIYDYEAPNKEQEPQRGKKGSPKKAPKANGVLGKLVVSMVIISVFAFSIFVLTRFTVITKSKHRVNGLQRQIEELELEKEKLRVEVEKVSKSGWIEQEAIERLDMQYPTPEQIAYININQNEVLTFKHEINKTNEDNTKINTSNKDKKPYTFLRKLVGYIGI